MQKKLKNDVKNTKNNTENVAFPGNYENLLFKFSWSCKL